MFQFPNRGDLLQFVDRPCAGPKCLCTMLRSGNDEHDILTNRDFTVAMDDQQLENIEILQRPFADLAQLLLGHPLVMFEGDAIDVPSLRPVSGRAEKY